MVEEKNVAYEGEKDLTRETGFAKKKTAHGCATQGQQSCDPKRARTPPTTSSKPAFAAMPLLDCLPQPLMGETITLVIAHPDDECMFFYPTISRAKRLHIICLSNGGYDGLGEQREKELQRAARRLGASATCINNAALQDGPHAWDPSVVAANVGPWLHAGAVVVTFDRYGASGHANHVAVYHGAAPASFARRGDGVTRDARRRPAARPDTKGLPFLRARDGAPLPAVHRRAGRGLRRRARAVRSAPVRAPCL